MCNKTLWKGHQEAGKEMGLQAAPSQALPPKRWILSMQKVGPTEPCGAREPSAWILGQSKELKQTSFNLIWAVGAQRRFHLEVKMLSWRMGPLYASLGFVIRFSVLLCMFDILQKRTDAAPVWAGWEFLLA